MGEAVKPFKNLVTASVFKILGLYYLTAVPALGVLGSAIALDICYMIMAILNYLDLRHLIGYRIHWSHDIFKPCLAASGMAAVIYQIKLVLLPYSSLLTLIVSLSFGLAAYLILLFLLGGIHRGDFHRIKGIIGNLF